MVSLFLLVNLAEFVCNKNRKISVSIKAYHISKICNAVYEYDFNSRLQVNANETAFI